jgi:hypothetical protein
VSHPTNGVVRKLARHIEESVASSLQWTTFEPNNQALWAQIEVSVNGFMHIHRRRVSRHYAAAGLFREMRQQHHHAG